MSLQVGPNYPLGGVTQWSSGRLTVARPWGYHGLFALGGSGQIPPRPHAVRRFSSRNLRHAARVRRWLRTRRIVSSSSCIGDDMWGQGPVVIDPQQAGHGAGWVCAAP